MTKPKSGGAALAPIIVKKITVVEASHHGGAWKVAYADFVTAMMAFFLLLWLLGSTNESQRKGLADYFSPTLVKTKENGAGADGLLGGSSLTDVDAYPHRQGQTGTKSLTIPRAAKGGPKEGETAAKRMQERLAARLAKDAALRGLADKVRMVPTVEGTRIDLVDDADFSMFSLGTTMMTPDARRLLAALADTIAAEDGALAIRGHTDGLPYKQGRTVNNWSLSAGRAEATRQQMIRLGVGAGRFHRIEGVADREPLIPANLRDPRNRRISITLAN